MRTDSAMEAIVLTDLGGKASRSHVALETADGFTHEEIGRHTITPNCIAPCGSLSEHYMSGSLRIIEKAQTKLDGLDLPEKRHYVVGTAPLRDAPNLDIFTALVEDRGFKIHVLSGEVEARLIAEAAVMRLQETKPDLVDGNVIVFKLGGRSSEMTLVKAGRIVEPVSIPFGARKMSNGHTGKLDKEDFHLLLKNQGLNISQGRPIQTLALCGGLMTAIGKLRARVLGKGDSKIHRDEIGELQQILTVATPREISRSFGISPEKAIHLGHALTSASVLMDTFDIRKARIPGTGLRHGVFQYHFTYGAHRLSEAISA